jgi:hypothetical protein
MWLCIQKNIFFILWKAGTVSSHVRKEKRDQILFVNLFIIALICASGVSYHGMTTTCVSQHSCSEE